MEHCYEFFDRAAVDCLWHLPWTTILRRHRSDWFHSREREPGVYGGTSLRELLAFAVDPEPSDREIDRILARLTVSETIRRCGSQFWTMDELIHRLLRKPEKAVFSAELGDISGLIAVATRGFLDGRIRTTALWSVAKLHNSWLSDWLRLSPEQVETVNAALPWQRMNEPIYDWQGEEACTNGEWANCLGVTLTRRFSHFVVTAYRENWPAASLKEDKKRTARRFGSFPDCVSLAKAIELRFSGLRRPCVTRAWE